MRILAVGAHPDDLEIFCGGTLFRYVQEGHQVELAIATDGSGGWRSQEEMKKTRRAEAASAAALLGAPLHWLDMRDEFLFSEDLEVRKLCVDLVRKTKPDIVLTHYPGDYHPDHRALAKLIFDATFVASVDNVATREPSHNSVPALFYFDTMAGVGFEPEHFVDISSTFSDKRNMLKAHASQLDWLRKHDHIDVLEFVDTVARFRGLQAGVSFAEGFRQERSWPRSKVERLLP